jgi:hypothetical protein
VHSRRPRGQSVRAFFALVVTQCLFGSCYHSGPIGLHASTHFTVLPRVVFVRPPESGAPIALRLEVVARNAVGEAEQPPPLTWTSSPAGASFIAGGSFATVTLPAGSATSGYRITAANGTDTDDILIIVSDAESAPIDEVYSPVVLGGDPDVVLASGLLENACTADSSFAFVGAVGLGRWSAASDCARAERVIFSVNGRPQSSRPMLWTSGQDVVNASPVQPPIAVPTQVVIGVSEAWRDSAQRFFNGSALFADAVFHNMRAGVQFPASQQNTLIQTLPPSFDKCSALPSLPLAVRPDPARINIYIIDRVETNQKGYFCSPNVVLVSNLFGLSSSLAHELSHALGMIAQDSGHVDRVFGFRDDNLMGYSQGLINGWDKRQRLSLGQVYRMHVDGRSYVKRGPGLVDGPETCPCDPYAGQRCPPLHVDVRPTDGAPTWPFPGCP